MDIRIATTFAFRNLKANKILYIPFIISTGIIVGLFNIMLNLSQNDYVQTRHASLPTLLYLGVIVIGFFSAVFIIYAAKFLSKRRSKEYALYTTLGLEKRHIRRIIFIEYLINMLIISVFSTALGYVLGKFLFIMLNRAMHDMNVRLMDYPFSVYSLVITIAYIGIIFLLLFIDGSRNLKKISAIELMSQSKSKEKEPKLKFVPLLLGIISLGAGYILALNVKGTTESLLYFFVAAILVAIGTYLLFTALSIAILKMMKKNKRYYYREKNFLSISGMMYRMKSNALGLASIAILCTGVIITISATLAINSAMPALVSRAIKNDYTIRNSMTFPVDVPQKDIVKAKKKMAQFAKTSVTSNENIKNFSIKEEFSAPVIKDSETIKPYADNTAGENILMQISTLDSYNKQEGTNYRLKKNQVLITSNRDKLLDINSLKLGGKRKKIIKVKDNINRFITVENYSIVVRGHKELSDLAKHYQFTGTPTESEYVDSQISLTGGWDVKNGSTSYLNNLKKKSVAKGYLLETKPEVKAWIYDINGGFLFLGIIIGCVFLIGTILITYYKQISEGYEDRRNYQIMKKVGLPDALIKKSSSSQIVWMFFIPLIVAILHSMVASKIVYQLLGLFGLNSYMSYLNDIAIIVGSFAVIYFIIFKLTSNIYYKIVR